MERAAQGCIDSLTTPEAQSYRRRMGFADEEVRCAVVICEMVDALCAGVAFSCDPANGRRDLILSMPRKVWETGWCKDRSIRSE